MKYVFFDYPNGEVWRMPARFVAEKRAEYYAERDYPDDAEKRREQRAIEIDYALGDHLELYDWLMNNMHWETVESVATQVRPPQPVSKGAWSHSEADLRLEEVDEPVPMPGTELEMVCLCGSTRFKDEYRKEEARLELEGKMVLSVGSFMHADNLDFTDHEKAHLDWVHKRKIDRSDRVHVINPGGYVGDSTRSEIEHARNQGTPVTWLEEPEDDQ